MSATETRELTREEKLAHWAILDGLEGFLQTVYMAATEENDRDPMYLGEFKEPHIEGSAELFTELFPDNTEPDSDSGLLGMVTHARLFQFMADNHEWCAREAARTLKLAQHMGRQHVFAIQRERDA